MAQRRMFTKAITNSSEFLMMPPTAQLLYIHFGMNADDDGFCEIFPIMRMTDSKPDDLRVLQARNFVKIFDDRVLIIVDWRENNYLRSDRYTPSKYLEIYKEELKQLSSGIPMVYQMDTQVRLGKVSKDKENKPLADKPQEFVLEDKLREMEDDEKREDLQIIASFIRAKKLKPNSSAELSAIIRRHLRAAKQLIPFSTEQLVEAKQKAEKMCGNEYTLETIYKYATK